MKKLFSILIFTLLLVSLVNAQGGTLSNYEGKQIGDPDVACSPGYARDFEKVCVPIKPVTLTIDYSKNQGFSGEYCRTDNECLFGFECDLKEYKCKRTAGYGYSGDLCKREGDCIDAFSCNVKTHFCEKSLTYGGQGDLCKTNLDCRSGFACNSKTHKCESYLGDVGSSCNSNSECRDGLICDSKTNTCANQQLGKSGDSCQLNADCEAGLVCNSDTNICQSIDALKEKELENLLNKEKKTAEEKQREIDLLNEKIKALEDQLLDEHGNKALLEKQLQKLRDLLLKEQAQEERRDAFFALFGDISRFFNGLLPWWGWIIFAILVLLGLFFAPVWTCHECGAVKAPLRRCHWNRPVVSDKEVA